MRKKLKETEGAVSLYVLIMLVFLLPFAIWVGIELPKSHELNQRVIDAVNSASQAGVTLIANDEIKPETKVVPLDEKQARALAMQIFASKMGLEIVGDFNNAELVPPEGSHITSATVQVEVLDGETGVSADKSNLLYHQTANGKRKIEHSTVIVTATVTYGKIGFWGNDITVTHVGMNQVKMKNY